MKNESSKPNKVKSFIYSHFLNFTYLKKKIDSRMYEIANINCSSLFRLSHKQ